MVNKIITHTFPQRKNEFKEMVGQISLKSGSTLELKSFLGLQHSARKEEKVNLFFKDSERWENFQNHYQDEFDNKIRLMDEIRGKKKEDELLRWIFATDYPQI